MSDVADRSNKRKNLELTVGFSIVGSLVAFDKNSFFGTAERKSPWLDFKRSRKGTRNHEYGELSSGVEGLRVEKLLVGFIWF